MMIRTFTLLGILLLAVPAAQADGIAIEPGMWEMTSTMHMPMLPEPRVTTTTECMEKSELSMDEFADGDMDPTCTFEMNLAGWQHHVMVDRLPGRGRHDRTANGKPLPMVTPSPEGG